MFQIRFHGRGGQGMKTASRILGSAFFEEGFEVQDAPRYGAERRGAPIFAYVRAAPAPITERGIIRQPDLVVVADDTLVAVPAAGVLQGVDAHTVLLLATRDSAEHWRSRLNFPGRLLTVAAFPDADSHADYRFVGAACAGAAARLVGVISREALSRAIAQELGSHGAEVVAKNVQRATEAFDAMADHAACIAQRPLPSVADMAAPAWVNLDFETADVSAPAVYAAATSVQVRTGLWRTLRPVIDYDRCSRCWWVCSSFCPDGAIAVEEGKPVIDYDHCKGCMICVAQCPPHAIHAVTEAGASDAGASKERNS